MITLHQLIIKNNLTQLLAPISARNFVLIIIQLLLWSKFIQN